MDRELPAWPGTVQREVETKGQYLVKMTQAREAERQTREQIRLKAKEDELARMREQLNPREAAIKRKEQELKFREAAVNNKNDAAEPSSGRNIKGKQPRCTQ